MEGILKVTPEELQTTATDFGSKGNTIKGLADQMMSIVKNLSGTWQGEASTIYLRKFQGLQNDIDKINGMIQEHVTDLNTMADQYKQAESANQEFGQSLTESVIS